MPSSATVAEVVVYGEPADTTDVVAGHRVGRNEAPRDDAYSHRREAGRRDKATADGERGGALRLQAGTGQPKQRSEREKGEEAKEWC